jgi:transcriptional regulator with XRE-family HTH domain
MKRLKLLREKLGKTQQEVAEYLNITRAAYSQYELGTRSPDYKTLIKLADYYYCSADYLLERTDIKNPYKDDENIATGYDEREAFTEEELEEIKSFKEYVISQRKNKK